ncbi:hypothetical protein [Arthrobacter sp. Leaf69]|uniref:hypothetical protein n=1 Tax=Arthrobacter sp. Leaf69 TaxID=1736232 RepID=UPI00191096BC|nr:hypothetical protein [Arthrobacter sp. Leaf69]
MAPAAQALPMETDAIAEQPAPVDPPAAAPPGEVSPAAPDNVSPPVIEGDPVAGGTLTSTGGRWNGAGWIKYRWIVDGVTVQAADHPVGEADVLHIDQSMAGKAVQLTVLASLEAQGLGTELAATPVTVRQGSFTGVSWNNAVIGKPVVGQALSLSAPRWSNSAVQGAATGFQWYRGAGPIAGATGPSHTVAAADDAQKLWAKVTLSAPGFTSVVLTSAQVTAGKGSSVTAPVPTVGGIAKVGQLQTANAGTWAPTGATLSYQWYRGTAAIVGAVSRTYTTTALDYGKTLKVRVRAAKSGYIALDRYSAARPIAAGTIAATKSLTVSGTHRYERTVKVSQGWTAGSTIRYQWYRNGVAIRGGTGYALYLSSGYIGARVNVKVTVSKAGYATRSATTPAITVGKALITLKTAPRITGATSLGSTLTANVGTYAPAPSAYAYQWYRNGAAITGARYRTYRLAAADNGRSITVRVSAGRIYSDTRVTMSPALKLPVWPVTVLRGDGTYRVGTQIKPGLYKATGGSFCYWARLRGFSGSTKDINKNDIVSGVTYVQIFPGDVGFKSSGCGGWTTVPSTGAKATRITKDGTYRVGIDILPGMYKATGTGNSCYWARLGGFGGSFGDINKNDIGPANTYVEILPSDVGFRSQRCGGWTRIAAPSQGHAPVPSTGARATSITADGTYRVGIDILSGTYYGNGAGDTCYWATLSGLSGSFDDIIENYFGSALTVVTIPSEAKGFEVSGCGALKRR